MRRENQRRKRKQKLSRIKKMKMGKLVRFSLANSNKKYRGFKNRYNYQTNIHNLIYMDACFENVRYQASNITKCNFKNTKLTGVEFYNTNLKQTSFKGATFKDVIFFNCNLKGTDFKSVEFMNVIFVSTNLGKARNLNIGTECTVLNSYPKIQIDKRLEDILFKLVECDRIYKYHVLHVKKEKINMWNIKILLDYNDKLIRVLEALYRRTNKDGFYTVYSYKKIIDSYLHI